MLRKINLLAFVAPTILVWSVCAALPAVGAEAPLNPHLREGCIACHGDSSRKPPGGTVILAPSAGDPHEVLIQSCRTCHQDRHDDFWIVVMPPGKRGTPERTASTPTAAPTAAPEPGAPPPGSDEGFPNPHDSLECAKCHEKDPGDLKNGLGASFSFGSGGVNSFCRRCHEGSDKSHFPQGNRPREAVTCLSCHQAHGNTLLYPALRQAYPLFLMRSSDINPHGGTIFCLTCHQDSPRRGEAVTFRNEGGASGLCRRCHDEIEHHPLDVASSPKTWKMDFSDFPLKNDKLTCVTCHDPYECDNTITGENKRFLRGGPYNAVEDFCMRCHEGRSFVDLNPHDQVDDQGNVREKQCLYCHTSVPTAGYALGEDDFTDALGALCLSCHPVGPHPDADHLVEASPDKLRNLTEYAEERMVSLPLESDSIITCVTCHNPHERGLLKGPSGVGADEENRLRMATFNEICSPCHGRH
jgi:hypothetical protein